MHVKTGLALVVLCLTSLAPLSSNAAPVPPGLRKAQEAREPLKEQMEAESFAAVTGLSYAVEMERIRALRAQDVAAAEVRQLLERYRLLTVELESQARRTRNWRGTQGAYRLLCATHEVLVEKVERQTVSSAEWLQYAKGLERFNFALGTLKRADAFQAVLDAKPTLSEEMSALRGKQHALIVADQYEPGKYSDEIVKILNAFRMKDPKGTRFRESLLATGDHLKAVGRRDDARRCYEECLAHFGEQRGAPAKARLQDL